MKFVLLTSTASNYFFYTASYFALFGYTRLEMANHVNNESGKLLRLPSMFEISSVKITCFKFEILSVTQVNFLLEDEHLLLYWTEF